MLILKLKWLEELNLTNLLLGNIRVLNIDQLNITLHPEMDLPGLTVVTRVGQARGVVMTILLNLRLTQGPNNTTDTMITTIVGIVTTDILQDQMTTTILHDTTLLQDIPQEQIHTTLDTQDVEELSN